METWSLIQALQDGVSLIEISRMCIGHGVTIIGRGELCFQGIMAGSYRDGLVSDYYKGVKFPSPLLGLLFPLTMLS